MRIEIKDKKYFIKLFNTLFPNNTIKDINGITIDSRKVQKGDIFIALKGENHDGHKYIKTIYNKAQICISQKQMNKKNIINFSETNNEFISYLSSKWREHSNAEIFGITGSNGKTTTKDLIYHIFQKKFKCSKSIGNHNNSIGLPLSFLRTKISDEYSILELGASKPGEIKKLCKIFKPQYGLITNISNAHIKNFASLREILKTKLAIYESLPSNGVAFINNDSKYMQKLKLKCNQVTYGFKNTSNYNGIVNNDILTINKKHKIQIPRHLNHLTELILSTFAISHHFKINIHDYQEAINSFQLPDGRGKINKYKESNVIDDSYNANPKSLKLGLERFIKLNANNKKKIIIIGDMLELGKDSIDEHSKIGIFISKTNFDHVLTYGEKSRFITENISNKKINSEHFNKFKNLKKTFDEIIDKDDWVYIKGSRSMKLDRLFKT